MVDAPALPRCNSFQAGGGLAPHFAKPFVVSSPHKVSDPDRIIHAVRDDAGVMKDKLIYITSPSYSGSTLLTILLAEHPAVATIGELKASAFGDIERYCCSCGTRLLDCSYWQRLEQRLRPNNPTFDLRNWRTHFAGGGRVTHKLLSATLRPPLAESMRSLGQTLVPDARHRFDATLELNAAVMSAVLEEAQATTFLDGSKDPVRAKYFLDSDRWDMTVVALIRDGRGVTNSYMQHESTDMATALDRWLGKMQEIERLEAVAGSRFIVTRYEDLCADPLAECNRILAAAGLPELDELAFPIVADDRHILGNSMRLKRLDAVRSDEKWRNCLSEADLDAFWDRAEAVQNRFGYAR